MRATLVRRVGVNFPGLYRQNNVPKWQHIHQEHDGLRQWQKGPRAKAMLYPYYALLSATTAATMYMMVRKVLGYNTWWEPSKQEES